MSLAAATVATPGPPTPAPATRAPVVVLGLGNILLEDEGLGVRAVERLEREYAMPPGVEVIDGGTTGMGLLDQVGCREHLVIIDAIRAEGPPGRIVRLADDEVPVYLGRKVTPHQVGLADVLATLALTGESPGHVTLLGQVPSSLELTLDLSEPLRAAQEALIEAVVRELERIGHAPRRLDAG